MTEQEAKELIKYINKEYFYYDKEGEFDEINEALDMAISALEEIQQYRALGTAEQIKKIINFLSLDGETGLIDDANLLNQYRVLGTPEELREAREKQVPKKAVKKSFIIPHKGIDVCPSCKQPISKKEHHCKCGQAIDWSEE